MNDLISRRTLIEDLRRIDTECVFDDREDILEKALATVDIQPTIEAKPVVHGEWIDKGLYSECNKCGFHHYGCDVNFCGNCGADMRKKVEE